MSGGYLALVAAACAACNVFPEVSRAQVLAGVTFTPVIDEK